MQTHADPCRPIRSLLNGPQTYQGPFQCNGFLEGPRIFVALKAEVEHATRNMILRSDFEGLSKGRWPGF